MRSDLAILFSMILQLTTEIGLDVPRLATERAEQAAALHQAAVRISLRLDRNIDLHKYLDNAISILVESAGQQLLGEHPEIPLREAYNGAHAFARELIKSEVALLNK